MLRFLVFLFFSQLAGASDYLQLSEEELNPSTKEILIQKPEKHLRSESVIYDLNTELGIKDQRRFTGSDKHKIAMAGHLSGQYEFLTDLLGAELNYMYRLDRYNRIWIGAQIFQHQSFFDSVAKNRSSEDSTVSRPNNTNIGLMGYGPGMSYRFKLLLDFIETEDVFETIDVFINYVTFADRYVNQTYQGFGLTTNYGLHKRSGTNFFYGGKISYNVASVSRSKFADEIDSKRSYAIGWLGLGFELGFFF
jgi:hypothetical protein